MIRLHPLRPTFPKRASAMLTLAILGAALAAAPARAGDAAAGALLAQRWCSSCHAIGPDAMRAQSDAPSFPAIAAREKEVTPAWLAFRLLGPHPQMAPITLTRVQADDLAAYFSKLRP